MDASGVCVHANSVARTHLSCPWMYSACACEQCCLLSLVDAHTSVSGNKKHSWCGDHFCTRIDFVISMLDASGVGASLSAKMLVSGLDASGVGVSLGFS